MQTENRFLDDLARVASGAFGTLAGVRSEVETRLKQQFKKIFEEMDLVSREEFDVVKAMVTKARKEQITLKKKLVELESVESAVRKKPVATGKRRVPKVGLGKASLKQKLK